MTDEFGQRIIGIFAKGDTIVSTDKHPALFVKDPTGKYDYLTLTANGLKVDVQAIPTVTVTATDLDIRDLVYTQDNVAIKGSTGSQLVVNSDGSVNVVTSQSAQDSVYICGVGVNLVKDAPTIVVTETPASITEYISGVMVSGSGYCEWSIKFGNTGFEAEILHFWTTPSKPTEYIDLPDFLKVTTLQTIKILGTNREKPASPNSDFTGYGTIIRKN